MICVLWLFCYSFIPKCIVDVRVRWLRFHFDCYWQSCLTTWVHQRYRLTDWRIWPNGVLRWDFELLSILEGCVRSKDIVEQNSKWVMTIQIYKMGSNKMGECVFLEFQKRLLPGCCEIRKKSRIKTIFKNVANSFLFSIFCLQVNIIVK